MKRNINGMITNNYSGGINVGSYDFSDFMYDFANDVGFAKHHNKGLGGKKAFIENCNIRMYFTDKECDLDEAEIALLMKLEVKGYFKNHEKKEVFEGKFDLETNLIGYSEFTITGYDVKECTIGGHNLINIFCDHIGKYVNIVVEAEEM